MPRSSRWYRSQLESAQDPSEQLSRSVAYLRAVVADRDPALADIVFEKAAQQLLGLTEVLLASTTVTAAEVTGARYLPPHMEDPNRPGWLNERELRLRRRSWQKCKARRDMYAAIAAEGRVCGLCSAASVLHGGPAYLVIDHIIPLARGGTNDDVNLQVLCEKCNSRKGALL